MNRLIAALAGLSLMAALLVGIASRPASAESFPLSASSGGQFSCALDAEGNAFCWGNNNGGQLGNGTTTDSRVPVPVSGGLAFKSIATGWANACALTTGGQAYCWGVAGNNGDGLNTSYSTPHPVSGGHTFKSIAGGHFTFCALTMVGAAYCWGSNDNGQIGDGGTFPGAAPVAVQGGHTFSTISVATAACGITIAGPMYCWGGNEYGQRGDGSTTPSTAPVLVLGGHSFKSVSMGLFHACAITTTDVAYCWGRNTTGQLGIGNTTTPITSPTAVVGGLSFGSIATGQSITCGLTTVSTVYCWGGFFGWDALGNGSNSTQTAPGIINGGLTYSALSVSTGWAASFCAVSSNGPLYCWGKNEFGDLGVGDTIFHVGPQQVNWSAKSGTADFSAVIDPALNFTVGSHSGTCNGEPLTGSSTGLAVDLGRINAAPGVAAQALNTSTNSANGFVVYVRSTGPLGVIDDVAFTNAAPGTFPAAGTEAFGYTTSDPTLGGTADRFTNGGAKWAALSTTNAEVSRSTGPTPGDNHCVAYKAQLTPTTPAGLHSTSVIYTAVPLY